LRVYTLFSNLIDVLPNDQLQQLKGNSIYSYSLHEIVLKWNDLSITIHQMSDRYSINRQVDRLTHLIGAKAEIGEVVLSHHYIDRINNTKLVFGVEITPEIDERVNELISTICLNTNCLLLSGDTLFDESFNKII